MYNEKVKEGFIREYTNSINTSNVCKSVFDAVESFEEEWESDICTVSKEQLQPAINSLVGLRARSKWMRLIILKHYAAWCMKAGVPNACDNLCHINVAGLDGIRERTVSSPVHLEDYLNKVFDPPESLSVDNIYRCYYWMAYAGISEAQAFTIKGSDVDFSKMIVRCGDEEFPIYREAIAAYKNCVELNQFLFKHPLYQKDVWKDRAPGDLLMRGVGSVPTVKSARVRLSRKSKSQRKAGVTNLKLSYYRVWLSGLFHRTYEKERMGIAPDFSDIVAHQSVGKEYKLDSGGNTQEAKHRQLAHDYLEDYMRWKLAFKM